MEDSMISHTCDHGIFTCLCSLRVSNAHGCPGTLYVSSALPYAWVDISAGPTLYGPWLGGHRGQVG